MKNNNKGFTITELAIVIGFAAGLLTVIGLIYVAVHFLGKVW